MRICFVDQFLDLSTSGGSMHSLDLYASKFKSMGHDICVLTFYPKRNILMGKIPNYILISESPFYVNRLDLNVRVLPHFLKKHEKEFDVFHIHDPSLFLGASLYRKSGGKTPVVGDLNTHLFSYYFKPGAPSHATFAEKLRFDLIKSYMDRIMPVSDFMYEEYVRHGVPKEKMTTIYDGFDFEWIDSFKVKKEKKDFVTILYVGRLEKTKGVDLIIEACAKLKTQNWKLLIVGEGPKREEFEQLVHTLGIAEKVVFTGYVSTKEMYDYFSQSDIFVHAPRWQEPFGRAVVEAMHFGLVSLVADIGAPPSLVGDKRIVFAPNDSSALQSVLLKAMTDKKFRDELAKKGVIRAQLFGVSSTLSAFLKVYQQVKKL